MRDARAHVFGEAVLLEVDGLFDDLLFRFQISQSNLPSLTLFARQHTANTAIYRAISYLPRGAMPSCNASSDMPCQGRKAAPPQLTQHCPSPRPDQVHAHASTCCVVSSEVLYALAPAPLPEAMSRR